jgi:hypothetical protein
MPDMTSKPLSRFLGGSWILVALAFAVPTALLIVRDFRVDNDPARWISASSPEAVAQSVVESQFAARSELTVTWNGSTLTDPRMVLLQQELLGRVGEDGIRRGGSPYIAAVQTPAELLKLQTERGADGAITYRGLVGHLVGTGRLAVVLTDAGRNSREQVIQQIKLRSLSELGLVLDVHTPTATYVPEEEDAAFEGVAIELPEGVPSDAPADRDLEISWSGLRETAQLEAIRNLLTEIRGYPTAEQEAGAPLVASSALLPGTPVAVEVALSDAGRLDLASALTAIRDAAARSRIPTSDLAITGEPVRLASMNDSLSAAFQSKKLGSSWMLLACVAIAAVSLIASTWSLRRGAAVITAAGVLILLCGAAALTLTKSVNSIVVLGPIWIAAVIVPVMLRITTPAAQDGGLARRRAALTAFACAATLASIAAVPSIPVRVLALISAGGCLAAGLLLLAGPTGVQPHLAASESSDWLAPISSMVIGQAGWIRPVSLALLVIAAAGLVSMNLNGEARVLVGAGLAANEDLQAVDRSLKGTQEFDAVIRFDHAAQDQLRFLERLNIVRDLEATLRTNAIITGSMSIADYEPVTAVPSPNAPPRDRVGFNRASKARETAFRDEADTVVPGWYSRPTAANGQSELWRIRLNVGQHISADQAARQIHQAIQSVTRFRPGVDHLLAGQPILEHQAGKTLRQSVLIGIGAFLAVSIALSIALVGDLAAGIAIAVPGVLAMTSVYGIASWIGLPVEAASVLTGIASLLVGLESTATLVVSVRSQLRRGTGLAPAIEGALQECYPSTLAGGLTLAAPMALIAFMTEGWMARAALLGVSATAAQLATQLLVLPTVLAGRVGTRLQTMENPLADLAAIPPVAQLEAKSPLRKSA